MNIYITRSLLTVFVLSLLAATGVWGQDDATASATVSTIASVDDAMTMTDQQQLSMGPDVWVSVDENSSITTITPITTTIEGIQTVLNAAPGEATDTVRTRTVNGHVTTETGTAVVATATAASGAGSFTICTNRDGEHAPFCEVAGGEDLIVGNTYYIKWDPLFYESNTTVEIMGTYVNTTGNVNSNSDSANNHQAFSSGERLSQWGFWAYAVDSNVLLYGADNATIALALIAIEPSSDRPLINDGPRVIVRKAGLVPKSAPPSLKQPAKTALTIVLPVSLATVAFLTLGVCLWNRKTRRIDVKNIMGRGRRGYGISKSRMQRLAKIGNYGKKKQQQQDVLLVDQRRESIYRDDPYSDHIGSSSTASSNALGNFGSGRFRFEFGPGAGRNAFHDELRRQERDKLG